MKKILSSAKRFLFPLKKLDTGKGPVSLQIRELNDKDVQNLHESLGISEERLHELYSLAHKWYVEGAKQDKSLTWALERASLEVSHPNELYLLILSSHRIAQSYTNPLAALLGGGHSIAA